MTITTGTLWRRVQDGTSHAVASGALVPIPTTTEYIDDGLIRFAVRVLAGLRRKDEAKRSQETAEAAGNQVDPFLPPEKDLTVAEITDTHSAVLNKFNVVDHHLLIVTRAFEDQDLLLTMKDFEALWTCMREYESLGFYNGGRDAGASQRHKHLQVVPLPLVPGRHAVPIEPLLAAAPQQGRIQGFPFLHAFIRLRDLGPGTGPRDAAEQCMRAYAELLRSVGMRAPDGTTSTLQSGPYCLIVTREWMLLVPRSQECFEEISLNSLAFVGSLFVRDERQLARLREFGPMNVLRQVVPPMR